MDPLSDVLSLLKPQSSISVGLDAGGDWAIRFPAHEGIKFNAVMRGSCWVWVEGEGEPLRMEEGDCFLLTKGRPFGLATDPALPPIAANAIYDHARDGIATCNGGGDFFLIGGRFTFAAPHVEVLSGALPAIVRVREASSQASVLRWGLDQLAAELRERRPGGFLVSEHLAHIMLVHVLRIYLGGPQCAGAGWLQALADRQMSKVVGAIHADPARRWTLEGLAGVAGMSRSSFAQRFKQVVGTSPIEYLTRWRMLVASDRLRNSRQSVAAIALSIGYESESAFSTAFKRTMAYSPRQYQRQ
ncbi:AraC family transcriptional regulator [Devosia sp. Root413D1]|uniref:AraC family transcriptional regulator n=1 Tax=Devosia sp. Root413D1 TaxID=1736531 RepID=UPI0006F5AE89|nr:AraC family transcriptional regulator [Devosia sp. Root413D1]KQW75847.1 AraC family transcriptional regulator [Devosia sp. Root413D1]